MRIGIDSFVSTVTDPTSGVDVSPVERVEHLGNISRIALQMTNVRLAHANLLRGIELLGTVVAPIVNAIAG